MAIRFRCLHCHKLLSIGTRKAGQRIACPICCCQQIVPDGSPSTVQFSVRAGIRVGGAVPRGNFPAPPWLPPLISGISGFVRSKTWPLAMVGLGLALFLAVGIAMNRNPGESPVFSKEAQPGRNSNPDERTTKPLTALSQPPIPSREVTLVAENRMGRHRPSSLRFDEDPLTVSKPGQAAKEEPAAQKKKLLSPPVPLAIPPAKESIFKRRQHRTAEELRQQLLKVPEVALDSVPQTSSKLLAEARLRGGVASFPGPALLLSQRPDLAGLPLGRGLACMLGKEPAEALHVLAPKLRTCMQAAVPGTGHDFRLDADRLGQELLGDETRRGAWLRPEAVPALVQMLQVENTPVRLLLVEMLSQVAGKKAGSALAQRALFDLEPQAREAAVRALKERPVEEYREVLLSGLRYPWAPVADHAAEALVALEDQGAVPFLLELLGTQGPAKENAKKVPLVPEVVRIQHQANCLLCHPPSFSPHDLARGALPSPGKSFSSYGSGSIFVRADVTYLRQDFSVMQPVESAGPAHQRFDFLVRARLATVAPRSQGPLPGEGDRAQREAILFALRELTLKAE